MPGPTCSGGAGRCVERGHQRLCDALLRQERERRRQPSLRGPATPARRPLRTPPLGRLVAGGGARGPGHRGRFPAAFTRSAHLPTRPRIPVRWCASCSQPGRSVIADARRPLAGAVAPRLPHADWVHAQRDPGRPTPDDDFRIEHDTMGEVRVPADALWRAQTQRAVENFPISGAADRPALIARARPDQGRRRPGERRARACSSAERRRRDRRGGRRGRGRRRTTTSSRSTCSRPARAPRRNMNANEVIATLATARSAARRCTPTTTSTPRSPATTSSRRAIHIAATQSARRRPGPGAASTSQEALRAQGRRVRRGRQERAHAPDGRDAGHPRPGVRRLRRGRSRYGIERVEAALPRVARAAAGRHRGRHRDQHPAGFAAAVIDDHRRADRAAADRGPQPLRGPGRPGRSGRGVRCAAHDRGQPEQDRQRPALDGVRARAPGSARSRCRTCSPGRSIMPGKVNPVICEATHDGRAPR